MKKWIGILIILFVLPAGWYLLRDDTDYGDVIAECTLEGYQLTITNWNTWDWTEVKYTLDVLDTRTYTSELYTESIYYHYSCKTLTFFLSNFRDKNDESYKLLVYPTLDGYDVVKCSYAITISCKDPAGKTHYYWCPLESADEV